MNKIQIHQRLISTGLDWVRVNWAVAYQSPSLADHSFDSLSLSPLQETQTHTRPPVKVVLLFGLEMVSLSLSLAHSFSYSTHTHTHACRVRFDSPTVTTEGALSLSLTHTHSYTRSVFLKASTYVVVVLIAVVWSPIISHQAGYLWRLSRTLN